MMYYGRPLLRSTPGDQAVVFDIGNFLCQTLS